MRESVRKRLVKESMGIGKKAATTASAALLGRIITILIAGIAFILVARILGPSQYGIYAVSVAVASFFISTSDFGIGTTFSKFIGEYSVRHDSGKIAELIANGYVLVVAFGLLCTLLVFALSGLVASYALHNASYAIVLQVAAFAIVTSVLYGASYSALVGFGLGRQLWTEVAIQVTVQALVSISLALLGLGAIAPIIGLILGFLAGGMFGLYVILGRVDILGAEVSFKKMRWILGFASPLAVSNTVSNIAANIPLVTLGVFVDASIVGAVGVVQRASGVVGVISDSIGAAIVPMFAAHIVQSARNQRPGALYNYAVYVALVLIAPMMLYLALLSTPFTITVFSSAYAQASPYIAIMSIGVLLGIAGAYAMNLLTSSNKVVLITKCTALAAAAQLVALFVLVPALGGIGAVLQMFVVTPLAITAIFLYAARKELGIKLNIARILRVLIASAVSATFILPLTWLFGSAYILLLIAAGIEQAALYPPLLALTRAVKRRDLDTITEVTAKIPLVGLAVRIATAYSGMFCQVSRG